VVFPYLHPNRRYGVEQDHLQLFFEVSPPTAGGGRAAAQAGLFVQILAKDLEFALRDTIVFDERRLATLGAGLTAGVFYELDVNDLPPGAYQLSCAPANAQGHGWVAEFDVIWHIGALNRHGDELQGEGRTVFHGDDLDAFLDAGQAEREVMLEQFWSEQDPEPETPTNENYVEFRRRVAHVRRHLGGFGRSGAIDPRGTIYILLGKPDEIQIEAMPLNTSDLEDATVRVHDKYAPVRPGTQAKGSDPLGTQGRDPQARGTGGVPMDYSYRVHREIDAKRREVGRNMAFELWKYHHAGDQLFPNLYSNQALGLNFLFVDRTGTGQYVLESTNTTGLDE
jgi:GWxTD domain-containing protein